MLMTTRSCCTNALDDYEEGTWTPVLQLATVGTSSWTFDRQLANYTKVGNLVTFQLFVRSDAYTAGTGTGNLQVGGLPFTSFSTLNHIGSCSVYSSAFVVDNHPSVGQIPAAATHITLFKRADVNDAVAACDETSAATGANSNTVVITGSYRTD